MSSIHYNHKRNFMVSTITMIIVLIFGVSYLLFVFFNDPVLQRLEETKNCTVSTKQIKKEKYHITTKDCGDLTTNNKNYDKIEANKTYSFIITTDEDNNQKIVKIKK